MRNKDLSISEYIDFYGSVLEERQREIIDMYYNEDYSLSEISEIAGITRQGAAESIKKSTSRLTLLDEQLNLIERNRAFEAKKNELLALLEESDVDNDLKKELKTRISELIL